MQGRWVLNGTRVICDDRNVLFDVSKCAGKMQSVEESCPFPVLLSVFQFPCQEDTEEAGIARDLLLRNSNPVYPPSP